MATMREVAGPVEPLALLAKALASKQNGVQLGDPASFKTGPFDIVAKVTVHLTGAKSADTKAPKAYGIEWLKGIELCMCFGGVTRNAMRKALAIQVELGRVAKDAKAGIEREPRNVLWVDVDGVAHTVPADEIQGYVAELEARHAELEADKDYYASQLMEVRPVAGGVRFDYIGIEVQPPDPDDQAGDNRKVA
jgi:hypothetical protein